ncbi:MAG: hypothetical protein KGO02_15035 [Alphaproteobacteria bacterium]|nr:hypothetical protein [Alphaproteobacteria bacterium]
MSSSETTLDLRIEAASTPLIRLLLAMAAEWAQIAGQVEQLGNGLSDAARSGCDRPANCDLQTFDIIYQRAQGQANLLTRLSRKLAEDQYFDRKRVTELVADIPFEAVRAGLEAAFEGRAAPGITEMSLEDVEWL